MDAEHLIVGKSGEDLASAFLFKKNYQILSRNWRFQNHHEIDIIAVSPTKEVVAVEVRTLKTAGEVQPFESINQSKITRICQALTVFAEKHALQHYPMRVDVISVIIENQSIEHFESVDFKV